MFLKSEIHETHQSKIKIDNISDHYPSLLVLENLNLTKTAPHKIRTRKIGCREINEIKSRLSTLDWKSELANRSTNDSFNKFHDKLMNIIDTVVPEKIITETKKKLSVPWYTAGLKRSNERDKHLYKLSNLPTASVEQKLKYQHYHVEFR